MNETEIRSLFKLLADEAIPPPSVDLWPAIQQAYQSRHTQKTDPTRPLRQNALFLAGAAAFLLALILVIGPHNVAAAFRNLVGYLPGIGFVRNVDQAYVLSTPVTQERDGIRVTIIEAYADLQQTVLVYEVQPLPARTAQETEAPALPYLILDDSSILNLTHGDGGGKDGRWRERLGFPPLENRSRPVTLFIPRLRDQAAGAAPEGWQISFRLVPAPDHARLGPALELTPISTPGQMGEGSLPTTIPLPEGEGTPGPQSISTPDPYTSPSRNGVQLRLDSVAQTNGMIVLEMALAWEDPKWRSSGSWGLPGRIRFTDGNGNPFSVLQGEPPVQPSNPRRTTDAQTFIFPSGVPGPYTITLDAVDFRAGGQGSFPFDPGPSPQVGQEWALDQTLTVGGQDVHVLAARLVAGNREQTCLQFDVQVEAGIQSLALSDYDHLDRVRGGNATRKAGNGVIQTSVCYAALPTGPLTIQLDTLFFTVNGPWQVAFDLSSPSLSPGKSENHTPQPVPFHDTATSDPAGLQAMIAEIAGYKGLLYAQAAQPGWTHLKYEQQELLPSGAPRPAPQVRIEEYWDHIDAEGKIYEQVQYWTTTEGGKTLVGYRTQGELVSVWNDERVPAEPNPPTYDLYLGSTLQGRMENQRPFQLTREEVQVEGKPAVCFDLWIPFTEQDRSFLHIPMPEPAWGTLERFFIDPASGMLVRYEHFYVLDNGERVSSAVTSQMEIRAGLTPPQEVLEVLHPAR